MAITAVGHKPDLTKEEALAIFKKHFDGKYLVEEWKQPMQLVSRDFALAKNAFVGVTVKLEQTANETKFVYAGYSPKWWARALMAGLLSVFLWNGLTSEVKQFLESAPEFH
jgi:hypothetical protein